MRVTVAAYLHAQLLIPDKLCDETICTYQIPGHCLMTEPLSSCVSGVT